MDNKTHVDLLARRAPIISRFTVNFWRPHPFSAERMLEKAYIGHEGQIISWIRPSTALGSIVDL